MARRPATIPLVEPAALIASAIMLGGSGHSAETVRADHAAIMRLLNQRYPAVFRALVAADAGSPPELAALVEIVRRSGAGSDAELVRLAAGLVLAFPAPEDPVGVDLARVRASALRITDVSADGTAIRIRDAAIAGTVDLASVRAGRPPEDPARLSTAADGAPAIVLSDVKAETISILNQIVYQERHLASANPKILADRPPRVVGRDDLIADIDCIATAAQPSTCVIALHGLGGVGKTSLALEYAYRHLHEFRLAWQFAAEDRTTLSAGFGELATTLGARDLVDSSDPVIQVRAALGMLADRWLLLLDNAPDHRSISHALPSEGNGLVLVTTRSAHWPGSNAIEVPVLERAAARDLLVRATGIADQTAAVELADALGELPLALEQAAAYIRATGGDLRRYLATLSRQRAALLQRGEPWGYAMSVASTWNLALQQLQGDQPAAISLLRLLACYAPESIPIGLLLPTRGAPSPAWSAIAGEIETLGDELAFGDAVIALRRFSLVSKPNDGRLSVHRLVQAVTLDQLDDAARASWRAAAGDILHAAIPDRPDLPENWPILSDLLPHARAVLGPETAGTALIVEYLGASGDYATARSIQAEVLTAKHAAHGPQHPDTLAARSALAQWTGHTGEVVRARNSFAELLPDCVRVCGAEDAITLNVRVNLADWTGQAGQPHLARDMAADVLPICRRALGSEHLVTLRAWSELGFWTGQAGDPAAARDHYAQFLPIRERVLGAQHPDVLVYRDQYARWIGESGDPAVARDLCATLVPIYERVSGPVHPDTLWARTNLAWFTGAAGDAAAARDQYAELLPLRERVSGAEHHGTLVIRGNLAWWTGHAGDPDEARRQTRELLPIRLRVSGPDHQDTVAVREALAHWNATVGDVAGAAEQYAELLATRERQLGPDHPSTVEARREVEEWRQRLPAVESG